MSNQSLRQASVRAVTGTTYSYEGDWHALFDMDGIAAGTYNGRLLDWINLQLSASYTELNGAMYAYANSQGFYNWDSMGTFTPSGGSLAPGNSNIVLFGDSLEVHNFNVATSANSEELSNWSRGYYNYCRWFDPRGNFDCWYDAGVASRLYQGAVQAISGNSTTQMLARINDVNNIPDVEVVIQGGGTNDINQSDPTATILSNHSTMAAAHIARGAKVILITPPPRPTSGTNSWAAGGATRLAWFDVCAGMQAIADADPTNIQIVRRDLILSNADADRTPRTGTIQIDNVHVTPIGAKYIATDSGGLIEKLSTWVDPFTDFPSVSPTGERCTNTTLAGSSGTVSTGCTGVAPNGMRFRRSTGSAVTAVGSKENVNGVEHFKIVITRNGAGANAEVISVDLGANISTGLPADGTWLRSAVKIKATASSAYNSLQIQAREQPSVGSNFNSQSMRIDTGYLWANEAMETATGDSGWQLSPPWVWRTGGTSIIFNVLLNVDNTQAGTDTIWISRMHLWEITNPMTALGF